MMSREIQLDVLIDEHPQLKEKAIIDFINGIEVNNDHIHVAEKNNEKFFGRIWSELTGETQSRQNTIDQHTNEALTSVSKWLQCLQYHHVQSDLAIAKVADKLVETRAGVMCLQAKHQQLAQQVEVLILDFDRLDLKFNQLALKLQQVDAGRLAKQHLDAVFDKWEAGRLNHYPEMLRLYFVFDELYWGEFGNYCRQYKIEHEVNRLVQQVKDKALIQMKHDKQSPHQSCSWQEKLATDIRKINLEHQQTLAYLSDESLAEHTPMLWAVNQIATGNNNLLNCKNLPIILNIENTINRFANDFEVRNAQQRL